MQSRRRGMIRSAIPKTPGSARGGFGFCRIHFACWSSRTPGTMGIEQAPARGTHRADRSRADRGAAPGNRPCRVHNPRNAEAPVTTKVSRSPSCRSHIGGRDVAVCASTATRGGWLCLSHNIRILAASTPGVARRFRGAGRSASLNPRAFRRCQHSCLWRCGYASTMAASFRCDRPAMTGPKANRQCARTCGGGAR